MKVRLDRRVDLARETGKPHLYCWGGTWVYMTAGAPGSWAQAKLELAAARWAWERNP